MKRADEAGENRRANVSVHLATQDEVYRYSLLLHGNLFSVKGAERVDDLKPLRFAWRCALLQCAPLSVGSCTIRYLWEVWENSEVRQAGRAAMPRTRDTSSGASGIRGFRYGRGRLVRVRALPCSEGPPGNYRRITGERSCRWPGTLSFWCRTAARGGRSAQMKPRR